jgi:hypothetical protein
MDDPFPIALNNPGNLVISKAIDCWYGCGLNLAQYVGHLVFNGHDREAILRHLVGKRLMTNNLPCAVQAFTKGRRMIVIGMSMGNEGKLSSIFSSRIDWFSWNRPTDEVRKFRQGINEEGHFSNRHSESSPEEAFNLHSGSPLI